MGGDVSGLPTLESLNVKGKTVLVRTDLNVPMEGSRITDDTRIRGLIPTIEVLQKHGANKIVLMSHFDRPQGKYEPSMSLAPLVDALSVALGQEVHFGVDCVSSAAKDAVSNLPHGGILLLENLRFHAEEEAGDDEFAKQLASLGDVYVNDAFSCSHRAHASITGIPKHLPAAAGKLLQREVEMLTALFSNAKKPLVAVIGGSKISTKLDLLNNLVARVDALIIGGAMANTFLFAQGYDVGKSICEKNMAATAKAILANAKDKKCEIVLPVDLVVTEKFQLGARCMVVPVDRIPTTHTATDVGPASVARFAAVLATAQTVVWNGPIGAFETSPFDCSTVGIARSIASYTRLKQCQSIAGGGDTLSAIAHAGVNQEFTYLSTAGGAFLEWLEGKSLPGIAILDKQLNPMLTSAG